MKFRTIRLRTGHTRRVSDHELEVALIWAREFVEKAGMKTDMLEDKERLAMALIVTQDDVDALASFVDWLEQRNAKARRIPRRNAERIIGRIEGEEAVASMLRAFIAGRREWKEWL